MKYSTQQLAEMLIEAQRTAVPVPEKFRQDFTLAEAYAVQECIRQEKERLGVRIIGKKVGFTSRAMREKFGIDIPDYGSLFSDQIFVQGTPIEAQKFVKPHVEGEIAFLLDEDLQGPGITVADVHRATKGVMACLEFVDFRWAFTPTFYDSVADNAACGGLLLGSKLVPLNELDLRYIAMFMTKNGRLVNSGAGIEVMGDPVNAVAWLANTLAEHGGGLKAGQIVLSGAITAAEPVQSGDSMTVCFSTLGQISVEFA